MNMTARVETTPLLLRGAGLSVNADIEPGGSIRAMIMDAAGADVSGFGLDDCRSIVQGGARCELRWRGRDLAELAGETLRLAFEFQQSTVYALNAARVPASD